MLLVGARGRWGLLNQLIAVGLRSESVCRGEGKRLRNGVMEIRTAATRGTERGHIWRIRLTR